MKNHNITKKAQLAFSLAMLGLVAAFVLWVSLLTPRLSMADYNETSWVNTTLNITNSAPLVYSITLQDPIDLTAYNTTEVTCNITVFDFDNDTLNVSARLYLDGTVSSRAPDDNNNHYTNNTCTRLSAQNPEMNYSCGFNVWYYADNSSQWTCNVTVSDRGKLNASNESNTGQVRPLVAIKMDPVLDYGDLEVGEISAPTAANVTNAGNRHANISVRGYGSVENDGLAFNCSFGTIALTYERYDIINSTAFASMTEITNSDVLISDFYVPQRTNDTYDSINQTYWKVQIPPVAGGVCNGKLIFQASDKGN